MQSACRACLGRPRLAQPAHEPPGGLRSTCLQRDAPSGLGHRRPSRHPQHALLGRTQAVGEAVVKAWGQAEGGRQVVLPARNSVWFKHCVITSCPALKLLPIRPIVQKRPTCHAAWQGHWQQQRPSWCTHSSAPADLLSRVAGVAGRKVEVCRSVTRQLPTHCAR